MIEAVQEIISKTNSYNYQMGVHASFKAINDEWGLKFYYNEHMRDHTYELQMMAADIHLAPKLGDKFEMTTPDGNTVYGYITENIESTLDDMGHECPTELPDAIEDQYNSLIEKLDEIMVTRDLHTGNVGYNRDGWLVAIDFSLCSKIGEHLDDDLFY